MKIHVTWGLSINGVYKDDIKGRLRVATTAFEKICKIWKAKDILIEKKNQFTWDSYHVDTGRRLRRLLYEEIWQVSLQK